MKPELTKGVTMSNCRKFSLMIEDYIDGSLDEKSREKLEKHLSSCKDCQSNLSLSLKLREMTRESAEIPPEYLHYNIMKSVNNQKPHPARKSLKFAALCAACTLICLCCTVVMTMMPGRQKNEENIPIEIQTSQSVSFENTAPADAETAASNVEITMQEEIQDAVDESPQLTPDKNKEDIEADSEAAAYRPNTEVLTPAPEDPEEITEDSENTQTDIILEIQSESQASNVTASSLDSSEQQKPGGDEITLALLIVSGLLAIASFVAFLISLSSIRQLTSKKE